MDPKKLVSATNDEMASKSKSTIPWKPEKALHCSTDCSTTSLFSAADVLKLPSLSRVRNLEGTTLIWFDSSVNRNEEDTRLTQEELREINDYVVFHTEQQACIDCIKSITNERIFLVTSGRCASSILSQIEHLPQILTVFIFCLHPKKYSNLTSAYKKIAGIYCEHHDLIYSIRESIAHAEKQLEVFSFYNQQEEKSTRDLSKESAKFLWFQLFKDVILQMPRDDAAKQQMLQFCRQYYYGNKSQLSLIDEFQRDYVSEDDAIKWYTKESFLYKLVNKALRTEDIEQLHTFRFFISDLSSRLAIEFQTLRRQEEFIILYRGLRMQIEELSTLRRNDGNLIATNGYLSTTRSKEVALNFAVKNTKVSADYVSILYEIHSNLQELRSTIALADISALSEYASEQEVLFDIGATFKIMSIKEDRDENVWIVRLRTTDRGIILAQNYIELNKKKGEKTSYTLEFGKLLIAMGKHDQALRYFQNLLKNTQVEEDMADVYNQIGKAYRLKDNFEEAMQNYQHAYDLTLSRYPVRIKEASKALNNIAIIFRKWCQYDRALQLHLQALHMKENYCGKGHLETAKTLRNIGSVYEDKQQYDHAIEYYQHCLTIQQKHLPNDHIDIATTLQNIGKIYYRMNYLDLALDHFYTSLIMRQKLLLPDHNDIVVSLMNIANVYVDQGHFQMALEYYFKALDIQQKVLGTNGEHRDIAMTLKNVGLTYEKLSAYSNAIQFYEKALAMNQKLLPADHLTISELSNNITALIEKK